jgi:transposase InsO family protein
LRSDNGGEYTSKEFISFCIEAGIKRELIVPYNPQQNGVA